mmetsp:Transcript_17234/g.29441  ORF Transcript_17234/g.29441 Transcript_17234/m.29441 type:complete len:148 (+) Transcript_17234:22-465(+)
MNSEEGYTPWLNYGQSKLANILFARELNTRLQAADVSNVVSVCCHPGAIPGTDLSRHVATGVMSWVAPVFIFLCRPFFKTVPSGAATQVYLATTKAPVPGAYYDDVNVAASSKHAHNAALGKKLWTWTEEQVKPFVDTKVASPIWSA